MGQKQLSAQEVDAFVEKHPGYRSADRALVKEYRFGSYADGVAFAVAVAMVAERKDHHPDLTIRWAKVAVLWTTHDAGGITALDCELAELADGLAGRHGATEAP